jgi:hypothetical protein
MTVDTEGYEERFEDVDRANLIITFFFGPSPSGIGF